MNFDLSSRSCLIIYIDSFKAKFVNKLKKYGNISYSSKEMHYVVMYVDSNQIDKIKGKINDFHFVKKTVDSPLSSLNDYFIDNKMIRGID